MITLFAEHAKKLLERFFPPKFARMDGVLCAEVNFDSDYDEQGWAGNVQEKPYRDGIDRTLKGGL